VGIYAGAGSGASIKIMSGFDTENRHKTAHDLGTRQLDVIGMESVNEMRTESIPILVQRYG